MAEKIGQILIRKGKINANQLREALRTQQFFGGYLGSHLINLGFIEEAALGEILSEIYRVPFAPFDSIRLVRPEVLATVPAALAQRFRLVPIQIEGNRLHVVMLNPRDAVAINELSSTTGLNVTPWVAPEFRIIQALQKHYKLRKQAGAPIRVKENAGPAGSGQVYPSSSSQGAAPAKEDPKVDTSALGIDGHPIDAEIVPDIDEGRSPATTTGPLPRTLDEWRALDDEIQRGGDERGAPARTSSRPRREASSTGGPSRRRSDRSLERSEASPRSPGAAAVEARASEIDELSQLLAAAASRDEVARDIVLFMAKTFHRAAAFAVSKDLATGWFGAGEGFDNDGLRETSFTISPASALHALLSARNAVVAPVPTIAENEEFHDLVRGGGPSPASILLIPVTIRERLVTILYADNGADRLGPLDLALWKKVGNMMEVSLEIMILRKKMTRR